MPPLLRPGYLLGVINLSSTHLVTSRGKVATQWTLGDELDKVPRQIRRGHSSDRLNTEDIRAIDDAYKCLDIKNVYQGIFVMAPVY